MLNYKLTSLLILFSIFQFETASGAAFLSIDEKNRTIEIVTHNFFWGNGATHKRVRKCANEIEQAWVGNKFTLDFISEKDNNLFELYQYQVSFKILSHYRQLDELKARDAIRFNSDIKNNFIRIYSDNDDDQDTRGAAFGHIAEVNDVSVDSPLMVCAHEYGHLLGLDEMNPNRKNDILPSMMTQGGINISQKDLQVQKPDRWRNKHQVFEFDESKRKVSENEISVLRSMILAAIKNKQSYIGTLSPNWNVEVFLKH